MTASAPPAMAQAVYPPGTFRIDGLPVSCGPTVFILNPSLPDVGMAQPGVIHMNPNVLWSMPTSLKLFWASHECGHQVVGANESAADCWAIRLGRNQGWFPPSEFNHLIWMFRNNTGDITHPPGPVRVSRMIACYNS